MDHQANRSTGPDRDRRLPKVDPESIAIRARPRRAIWFKRGVIIAIAAIGSVSLIAVTWMALRPW